MGLGARALAVIGPGAAREILQITIDRWDELVR
jgi:hypothetical protein